MNAWRRVDEAMRAYTDALGELREDMQPSHFETWTLEQMQRCCAKVWGTTRRVHFSAAKSKSYRAYLNNLSPARKSSHSIVYTRSILRELTSGDCQSAPVRCPTTGGIVRAWFSEYFDSTRKKGAVPKHIYMVSSSPICFKMQ